MQSLTRSLRALAAVAVVGAATSVSALNMSYGDVSVSNLDSWGFTSTNSQLMTNWNGSTGTDQLYQMYGYIGVATGTGNGANDGMVAVNNTSFTALSAIAQTGANTASSQIMLNRGVGTGAARLAPNSLTLTYDFTLVNDTSVNDRDQLAWDIGFTNNTAGTISFVFYTYLDLDLLGTPGNDLASLMSGNQQINVLDATNPTAAPFGWSALNGSATRFQVSAYPGLQNTLNGMSSAQNLSNTNALSSTPGDVTAAFQYSITLLPGQTLVMSSAVAEPQTASLLALGLGGLAFYARPRRRKSGRES